MWGFRQESDVDKDVWHHDKHAEPDEKLRSNVKCNLDQIPTIFRPEASYSNPSPLEPDCSEERGQGDDVDNGGEGEEEVDEGVCRQEPQEGVQEEDDGKSKVNLNCDPLVPRNTLFNQT